MLRVRQEAALFVEGDVIDKDQRDPTNTGVVYNSVLTGSEQFTGSAGDLNSVPNQRPKEGANLSARRHRLELRFHLSTRIERTRRPGSLLR